MIILPWCSINKHILIGGSNFHAKQLTYDATSTKYGRQDLIHTKILKISWIHLKAFSNKPHALTLQIVSFILRTSWLNQWICRNDNVDPYNCVDYKRWRIVFKSHPQGPACGSYQLNSNQVRIMYVYDYDRKVSCTNELPFRESFAKKMDEQESQYPPTSKTARTIEIRIWTGTRLSRLEQTDRPSTSFVVTWGFIYFVTHHQSTTKIYGNPGGSESALKVPRIVFFCKIQNRPRVLIN